MRVPDWKPLDEVIVPDWVQEHIDSKGDALVPTKLSKEEKEYAKVVLGYKESKEYVPIDRTSYKQLIEQAVQDGDVPNKS